MSETRPSGRLVVGGPAAIVTQEVAHIDKKGCLNLLPRWTAKLSWLAPLDNSTEALLIFLRPGRISIRDLATYGPRIRERYNEIAADVQQQASLDLLRLLQDRYGQLYIPKSRRVSLGDPALLHLQVERGVVTAIYVAVFPSSIDLLSVAYRNEQLMEIQSELEDLPFIGS
jgi:hypothetical protein